MNCVEVKHVTKNFGNTCALDDICLSFEENKIYGLLGRNGAGKSTLLNVITNRIYADQGEVYVNGEPVKDNDKALGQLYLMSEKTYYPEKMKIKDIFKWTKTFYPDFDEEYAANLAERFGLKLTKNVKSLSTGYTSIFKLIIALSVNTPYIFLDEPVLGLDANHRDLFYRILLEKYSENPCTIVISTHLIEEISNLIENIIIIKKSKIIRNESCESLLAGGYTVSGSTALVDSYISGKNVIGIDSLGGLKSAYILGKKEEELPDGLEVSKLDLQKLFVQLTN
ncbi:ABC transporter ATP-binding protein [Lachnospiraceae bacterium MD1]|uniref:ABC transporter ATP-binding protein n=1 Tax=Variimorphobacter saccharofermentans TaxID=2755051 RepID=A0A839JV45_9FIRM|nr:ABC transporter ATP-binding protein [Variimorphobacter saccharofermentans]MBB2181360.1 ABC transporter ATP-binding protein [Variimorphobacter saccharofermentans]